MASGVKFFHKQGISKIFELCIVHVLYFLLFIYNFGLLKGTIYAYAGFCVFCIIMDKLGYQKVSCSDVLSGLVADPNHSRNIACKFVF